LAADQPLLDEDDFAVRVAILDHGIPCLAFALEETMHVNIWKNRLEELGLGVGPWLRDLKRAIVSRQPDETPISARWQDDGRAKQRVVPLGELRDEVASLTPGKKIAYVVDAAHTSANVEAITALAKDATVLFIETPFLHADVKLARERNHLTACQAGNIARQAGAERIVSLHYSPRYEGRGGELRSEAEHAFRGVVRTSG
jgi:ribonuclease Z